MSSLQQLDGLQPADLKYFYLMMLLLFQMHCLTTEDWIGKECFTNWKCKHENYLNTYISYFSSPILQHFCKFGLNLWFVSPLLHVHSLRAGARIKVVTVCRSTGHLWPVSSKMWMFPDIEFVAMLCFSGGSLQLKLTKGLNRRSHGVHKYNISKWRKTAWLTLVRSIYH